jgi:Tfp pilus assembly protein PilX
VHHAFGTVLWVVCIAAVVLALVGLIASRRVWDDYGKNGLLLESEFARDHSAASPAALRERDEEIRQMLEARNARRLRRGEEPLDIDAELSRLTAPAIDPELRSEIRDLVVARNYRRSRTGKPPLDVEAEIEREIAKLSDSSL